MKKQRRKNGHKISPFHHITLNEVCFEKIETSQLVMEEEVDSPTRLVAKCNELLDTMHYRLRWSLRRFFEPKNVQK